MATVPLPGTQKHPHESDNSDSDKEAPFALAAQDYGISSDHLALVVKVVEPLNSSGWIDVRKKKAERILSGQHNDLTLSHFLVMFHLACPRTPCGSLLVVVSLGGLFPSENHCITLYFFLDLIEGFSSIFTHKKKKNVLI
jgi:hypothetical protein